MAGHNIVCVDDATYEKTAEGFKNMTFWNTCHVKDMRQMKKVVDLVIIVFIHETVYTLMINQ